MNSENTLKSACKLHHHVEMILVNYIIAWFNLLKVGSIRIARLETRIMELCDNAYVTVNKNEFIFNVCISILFGLRISVDPNDCELFLEMGEIRAKFG